MNSQSKKMELLGSTSIPKALLAMGIPTMIGMLVNAFYNLVDAYFVGGLGESQMGAISVVYPLGQVVVGFILGACRQGICFIPVILLLPMVWGLNGIMYAQPIADVLSAIITVFMAIPLHKKLNEMQKQTSAISKKDND